MEFNTLTNDEARNSGKPIFGAPMEVLHSLGEGMYKCLICGETFKSSEKHFHEGKECIICVN